MAPMSPERRGFEIMLSDDMAAQRYIWPVESTGIPLEYGRIGCEHSVCSWGLRTP